ncbi:hypothetical protein AAG906_035389 [Vitis piasezkii]
MTSHLPRFLTAACRVMVILPSPQGHHDKPKSLPTIKEGSRTSDTIKRAFTQRERNHPWLKARVHLVAAWIPGTRGINIGAICENSLLSRRRRCPHLPEAACRLEETKAILNGVKPWKGDSWRASDKCRLSSRKQQD